MGALTCYIPESAEHWQAILDSYGALAPHEFGSGLERFESDTIVWTGNRQQGAPEQAKATTLAYSFPADNVTWGLAIVSATGPNVLNAELEAIFGASALDLGREHFRQALAGWERLTGLTYVELPDDGLEMEQSTVPTNARGDIRFGAVDLPESMFAAYNAAPSMSGSVGVGGGDMLINAAQFTPEVLANPADSFRLLRNLISHEHGHGLGFLHVVPCSDEKLMEPVITSLFDGLRPDEIRGGARHYGDRFAGNHTAQTALDFGDRTIPSTRSVAERGLSTNGAGGVGGTGEDWFRFTLSAARNVTITVTPMGGVYDAIGQLFGCFGVAGDPTRDAAGAGNLTLELRDSAGATTLLSASAGGPGVAETISVVGLGAGQYTIRVFDAGPNDAQDQVVQMYDLTVRLGLQAFPPEAVAGVNKRVRAGTTCYFIGDLHSSTNEPGATIAQFDWDLDGDGVFESQNNPRPTFVYVSNGEYDATLRVTDSNGKTDTDTIKVTVFGALTTIAGVTPDQAERSSTLPVTLTGTNLKTVDSASEVTVLGGGVQVTGNPQPNALGTSLAGLSFVVAADAAIGARDVRIANDDGVGIGVGVLTVVEALVFIEDLNGDGIVDGADLAFLLANWGECAPPPAACVADINHDGQVGGADLSFLLAVWGTSGD